MARIFITGSSDGLGSLTARKLVKSGHKVVLHARNAQRAKDASAACPGAEKVLIADLSSMEETKQLAEEVNAMGEFDAVVHNAGVMRVGSLKGKEGIPATFAVNTLAPYILTCLIQPPPKRLVYVSSGLHSGGDPSLKNLQNSGYGDTKLHDIMLAQAFSKRWAPKVTSNSVDPGWVKTNMGGSGASGDLDLAVDTFAMLAAGDPPSKGVTGKHWFGMKERSYKSAANDEATQDKLLKECEQISGVSIPDLK